MQLNPQTIHVHVELYANELLFYYLMLHRSQTNEASNLYKSIFMDRLGQSEIFTPHNPRSIRETGAYITILAYRKWTRQWKAWNSETDQQLIALVKNDLNKNVESYRRNHPMELKYCAYVNKKFDLGFDIPIDPDFKWWVFFSVPESMLLANDPKEKLNHYDLLVGYYATHEIFIDSDYGQKKLDKNKYPRELSFIRKNMPRFMANRHCDLIAEFAICLQILGETNDIYYKQAIDFLIQNQQEDGSWPPNEFSYNNKHTTIVALWALSP